MRISTLAGAAALLAVSALPLAGPAAARTESDHSSTVPGGTPPPLTTPAPSAPAAPAAPLPHGPVRAGSGPVPDGGAPVLAVGLGSASVLAAGGAVVLRRRQSR
ncbi:hypothetical protein ACWCYY_06800 [Kitasatospora sp. NPDC001664]